ncbi:hypothetical protein TOPH_02774 [Tolypocladium ophioglossoides CBS 100239]|uniref:Uncharacterized protein n=1 Tax=Tolypocladium ophioglossoides (strain CBS 100239) TaxID=1163406 RepID=A0A0L0NEE6_TOLOC|nr:hypothetical protein TOPH_02774 [Tolypocladium ophioglossoides CBS 100239]
MKFSALSIGLFAGAVLAAPSRELDARDGVQTAHLTFLAASSPETYALAVKADGSTLTRRVAGHDLLNISRINAPDYLAASFCKFHTPGPVTLASKLGSDNVTMQIILQPPQPVLDVRCEGVCVPNFERPRGSVDMDGRLLTSPSQVLQRFRPRGALLQRLLCRGRLPPVEQWAVDGG